ncbi:MAG: NUDIX hydrolase [Acidimicrobiales bacterium]
MSASSGSLRWELIGHRPGPSRWIKVVTNTYRMPDGAEADWDIMAAVDAIAVVALTEDERVVLARQFRPGPDRTLDELPGGELNEGETPLHAAIRELSEETGYAGETTVLGHTWQGANITRRKWAALATNCRKVAQPLLDPSEEFCETITVSLTEFRRRLRSGQLTDGWAGYVALDHLG